MIYKQLTEVLLQMKDIQLIEVQGHSEFLQQVLLVSHLYLQN